MLSRIRIVLVNPSHPGNIGAASRAMKTMGLSRLYLVQPKLFPHVDALAMAAGAEDILSNALVSDTLEEALQSSQLVIGASGRHRDLAWPCWDPRTCGREALHAAQQKIEVAIVFGCEHSGLSNEQLQRCHYQVQIPTQSDYGSLNLAAAVQVLCYEMRMASLAFEELIALSERRFDWATNEEIEAFYEHLRRVLVAINFLDNDNPRLLMSRIRRLFARSRLERTEINILRGILKAVEKLM